MKRLRDAIHQWVTYAPFSQLIGVLILILVTFAACVIYLDARDKDDGLRAGFRAWVKQTDNPKALTYEEWLALVRLNALEGLK